MNSEATLQSVPDCTIFLLRHGRTAAEALGRYIGQTDVPLSPEGRAEVARWRGTLENEPFSVVCSSDLRRCRETAEIIFGARIGGVSYQRALREIDMGLWEGLSIVEMKAQTPEQYARRGEDFSRFRPPCGESFLDLQRRALSLLSEVTESYTGNILLITHAGIIRVILCHVLGLHLDNLFRLDPAPAGLSVIRYEQGRPVLKVMNSGFSLIGINQKWFHRQQAPQG